MIHTPAHVDPSADGVIAPISDPIRDIHGVREPTHFASRVARIRVRVAHEVPLIGAGIRAILASSGDFEIVAPHLGSAPNALGGVSRAIALAAAHAISRADSHAATTDVFIVDIETGLRVLSDARATRNVLIVAHDDGEALIRKALGKGARGFLLHTCTTEELTTAVKTVSRGGTAFAPWVANRIVQSFAFEELTERELDVLHLMVQGLTDKDMARHLLIALGTVKAHVRSILTKLGASRRTEAAAIAQRRGLARLSSPLESRGPGGLSCQRRES